MTENKVTPWTVEGTVDYNRLIDQFGTELISQSLIERFEIVTGREVHPWIRRGIFFSHRQLNNFLDAYERGEPIFLYTGRGPTSESMHLGHLIPFMFTKWLQDVFKCPLVIQIADDEKYYFKQLDFDTIYNLGFENAKDIIACDFDPEKTFIFSNRDYRMECKSFEIFVSDMKKLFSAKQVAKIFGFGEKIETNQGQSEFVYSDNINVGMLDWPFYQSAAAFSKAFPHIFKTKNAHCLVAYAIDQDPYFRMARDVASKMNLYKPCSIMCTFVAPLTGNTGKMSSSSGSESTLFLTDSPSVLLGKIKKYSYSGGGGDGSLKDHRKFGGNTNVDISYQYLKYFEMNDQVLSDIKTRFESGELTCTEIKQLMANKLIEIFTNHQSKRSLITKATVENFYSKKTLINSKN